MGRDGRISPVALLAASLGLASVGAVLFWVGRDLTFFQDEWDFVFSRIGGHNTADTYLSQHNEHLLVIPVAFYKALFSTVGLGDYWPYRVMLIVVHLLCIVLLFAVARRSIGRRGAIFVILPFLFFGTAWEVVLYPFNVQWCGSIAALLGLLLLLDRREVRSQVACLLLLVVAIASSSLGVSIALGVLVEVLWHRDRWRRIWIPAVPIGLYGLWFVTYHHHLSYLGAREFPSPIYMLRAARAAMGGLLGLPIGGESVGLWVRPLLVLTTALITAVAGLILVWAVARRRQLSPRLAMLLVTLGSTWVLLAMTRSSVASAASSRYLYGGAFLIVLVGLELARGLTIRRGWAYALAASACVAGALNLAWLVHNAAPRREEAIRVAAVIGALEISRDFVTSDPSFQPDPRTSGARAVVAGNYFYATDTLGDSPAMTVSDIAASPEYARAAADEVLLRAARVRLTPRAGRIRRSIDPSAAGPAGLRVDELNGGRIARREGCSILVPSGRRPAGIGLTLPEGGLIINAEPGAEAEVRLRRFARAYPEKAFAAVGRGPQGLSAPLGRASVRWHAKISATRRVEICRDSPEASRSGTPTVAGTFHLVRRGDRQVLRSASGSHLSVVRGRVGGFVESVTLRGGRRVVSGWSATPGIGAAERVVVFIGGKFAASDEPSRVRQDVADDLGETARLSGFVIDIARSGERDGRESSVQVFGISGRFASELPRL